MDARIRGRWNPGFVGGNSKSGKEEFQFAGEKQEPMDGKEILEFIDGPFAVERRGTRILPCGFPSRTYCFIPQTRCGIDNQSLVFLFLFYSSQASEPLILGREREKIRVWTGFF